MRMNSLGQLIEGRERYWKNDLVWIEQQGSDTTGWKVVDSNGVILDNSGAAQLKAGGDRWAAWPPPRGNFASLDSQGIIRDIGFDGLTIWQPLYHSGGAGEPAQQLQILNTGELYTLPSGSLSVRACSNQEFVAALGDGRIWSNRRGIANLPVGVKPYSAMLVDSTWLLYYTKTYLVLQHYTAKQGVVIVDNRTQGDSFSPDIVRLADGTLKVMWSPNQAETNAKEKLFAPNFATVDLTELNDNEAWPPGDDPSTEVGAISIPTIERPLWQAPFFSHSHQYGSTSLERHVGNCAWVRTSEMDVAPPIPHITQVDNGNVGAANINLTVSWWVSGSSISVLIEKVAEALAFPEKPVIAFLDSIDWPVSNPFTSNRVWPSIQAYPRVGESMSDFQIRIEAVVKRVAGYQVPMVLTSRFDDTAGTIPVAKALTYMPVYEYLLREYLFVGHMPFSDRRGNAISSNESLWRWARGLHNDISLGRPNRFDYWQPAGSSIEDVLENKLGQSRAAVVLEPYLRTAILEKFQGEEPPPDQPPPATWPNHKATVEQVRAKYPPSINVDQAVAIVNEVAWIHRNEGFGLLRKESGNHGSQPHTGMNCSVDWCVSNDYNLGTDCLGSTPSSTDDTLGPATPQWGSGEVFDLARWVAPVAP